MRSSRYRSTRGLVIAVLGVSGCLAVAACGRKAELSEAGPFPRAPIVIVSIDTLRSDHLPAYGYTQVSTPAIDRLRRDGVLFERAYSHIPLTLPSHASILTGLLPAHHGVRDNLGYRLRTDRVPYLPTLLRQAGYRTGGAASAFVLRGETGISEGFETYDSAIEVRANEALGNAQRTGKQTLAAITPWLESVAAQPFFLFVHLYEPHTPYAPPPPFDAQYRDRPYDGEIAAADAAVGELFATLDRLGVYERSIVVLLSDHGEGLYDHGELEHGIFLYREALQVPLLLKLPKSVAAGTTVRSPAQLTDVTPTLLALAGLKPPQPTDGGTLLALDAPGAPARRIFAETFYARLHLGWSELFSLIEDRFQYIQAPESELYDLVDDPAEKNNVLRSERRTFAALRDAMAGFETALAAPAAEDPETLRQLAALGYLGTVAKPTSGPLPDPKAKIGSLRPLFEGNRLIAENRHSEAIAGLSQVVAENPGMADAWEQLGGALQALGRFDEAHDALRHAMEISGGSPHVALMMGHLLYEMGRLDEAAQHARLGQEANPVGAMNLLAQVAMAKKDLDGAERAIRAALDGASGSRIGSLVTLAQVLQAKGKLSDALAATDEAERLMLASGAKDPWPGLYLVRGDILARLERFPEAEAAFRREIDRYPKNPGAFGRLAFLYISQGRVEEAVATLRRLVESNPDSPVAYATAARSLRILGDPRSAEALLREARRRFPDQKGLLRPEGAAGSS